MSGSRKLQWMLLVFSLSYAAGAEAKTAANYLEGKNELSGGIGFSGDFTNWTPGGFKWFNDYSRQLNQLAWLNFQFNVTAGGSDRFCWREASGGWRCPASYRWGGNALELAGGVKLKWLLQRIPLQIHAKLGGAINVIFFPNDINGISFGFRGGAGARYFLSPTFGIGAELVNTFGPAFIADPAKPLEFFAAMDLNIGVEWRF